MHKPSETTNNRVVSNNIVANAHIFSYYEEFCLKKATCSKSNNILFVHVRHFIRIVLLLLLLFFDDYLSKLFIITPSVYTRYFCPKRVYKLISDAAEKHDLKI